MKKENPLLKEFKDHLKLFNRKSWWVKYHGNIFQTSIPDILIATAYGVAKVEFKWEKGRRSININRIIMDKLKDGQLENLIKIERINGPLMGVVIIGIPIAMDVGVVVFSTRMHNLANSLQFSMMQFEKSMTEQKVIRFNDGSRCQIRYHRSKFKWETEFLCHINNHLHQKSLDK